MADQLEEQSMECEALEAIYMEEFTDHGGAPRKHSTTLVPEPGADDNWVKALITFTLPPEYPNVGPEILVENVLNLEQEQLSEIRELMLNEVEENLGDVMAFTLLQVAQEYLQANNREPRRKPQDMHEEMLERMRIEEEANRVVEDEVVVQAREKAIEHAKIGTPVTRENFSAWKEEFNREFHIRQDGKLQDKSGKLNGRQLFENDSTLIQSDNAFQEEGDVIEQRKAPPVNERPAVAVDSSLFVDEDLPDDDDDDSDYSPES